MNHIHRRAGGDNCLAYTSGLRRATCRADNCRPCVATPYGRTDSTSDHGTKRPRKRSVIPFSSIRSHGSFERNWRTVRGATARKTSPSEPSSTPLKTRFISAKRPYGANIIQRRPQSTTNATKRRRAVLDRESRISIGCIAPERRRPYLYLGGWRQHNMHGRDAANEATGLPGVRGKAD